MKNNDQQHEIRTHLNDIVQVRKAELSSLVVVSGEQGVSVDTSRSGIPLLGRQPGLQQNDIIEVGSTKARANRMHRVSTDMLVNPQVIEQNSAKLAARPRQKRRINYMKKIMNDSFIMNV